MRCPKPHAGKQGVTDLNEVANLGITRTLFYVTTGTKTGRFLCQL